ncbi:MAG: DUF3047 domain-containing protein [Candidatus Lambdaproteobacteria bacterium]|nr:DUF3047 domain-containing protein [Candidatus Lambdaproteobacteria bacterium]
MHGSSVTIAFRASLLIALTLTAAATIPRAQQDDLDLLRLNGARNYPDWMAAEGWRDYRPFSDSRSRFRVEEGTLRLESAGDAFVIARDLYAATPLDIGRMPFLRFRVRVERVPEGASQTDPMLDDSAFRLVAIFRKEPIQALAYVWSGRTPVGHWSAGNRNFWGDFRRVRRKVFGQGPSPAAPWLVVEVNLGGDFRAQFPGEQLPPLVGLGLTTDSDDTRRQSLVWLREVSLHRNSLREQGIHEGEAVQGATVWYR